eukprot:Gb_21276 [translate_table: standard]
MGLREKNKLWWIGVVFLQCVCNSSFGCGNAMSEEVYALLALKSGIVDSFGYLRDWQYSEQKNNGSPCSWSGITCNHKSKVISLDLSQKNLNGTISNEVELLSHIVNFNISNNMFDGLFPAAIFNLSKLASIDVSHNLFSGLFPKGVSKLKNLVKFNAYSNSFTGSLPLEFVELGTLEMLNLGGSYFNGTIPSQYGSFNSLKYLHLSGNMITGSIPSELGRLQELRHMEIGYNCYEGGIPWELGNMTKLEYLDIAAANISGSLPVELSRIEKLSSMFLFRNNLRGFIPWQLSDIRSLQSLDLSDNMLTGPIPEEFSRLTGLRLLSLMYNNLSGSIPKGIGDLPNLKSLLIWSNSLTGSLPEQLGRNSMLEWLDASSNKLTGPIPPDLCAGNRLFKLILFSNKFTGEIPVNLTHCPTLWRFRIAGNNLSGHIPSGFGRLQNFTFMDFSRNNLGGHFPSDLCNAPRLQYMNVSHNSLEGGLPPKIWSSPSLQIFSAAFSNLSGKLPSFEDCNLVYKLELQGNRFSGTIPEDITHCQKLLTIELNQNEFSGVIPPELASLPSISEIDLSHNALTGMIPTKFENCTTLEFFNVSFNHLSGPVPSDGVFKKISTSVFAGNQGLCGGVLIESPCMNPNDFYPPHSPYNSEDTKKPGLVVWVMGGVFALAVFILVVGTRCFYKQYKWYICGDKYSGEDHDEGPWKMTAFQRLNFTVEDVLECLKSTNIIGMGAAGTVYKAEMPGGEVIAVKKLWRIQKEAGRRKVGVLAEVDVLGNVRHRNIVRLLGCCSNNENTLLLYEYMPNGSLADLLHGNKGTNMLADWMTRYKIAVGVAQGLCYLHQDCYPVIVHRDVKPSNILLDANMDARVADFGVAKLIQTDEESMSVIAGSYGYIAPEYAYTLQVHEKSDIYSFGVVLLELLTGRRPIDPEFGDVINIVDWVRERIQTKEGVVEVLDQNVGASCSSIQEEMMLVLRVALLCTSRSPSDRPSMRDVVTMLSEAKPRRKTVLDLRFLQQRSNPSSQGSSPPSKVLV